MNQEQYINFEKLITYGQTNKLFKNVVRKPITYKHVTLPSQIERGTFFLNDLNEEINIVSKIAGEDEKHNILRHGNVLLVDKNGHQCIMAIGTFLKLYDINNSKASPKIEPREVLHVTETLIKNIEKKLGSQYDFSIIKFKTPLGNEITLNIGDYIIKDPSLENGYYSMNSTMFNKIYTSHMRK